MAGGKDWLAAGEHPAGGRIPGHHPDRHLRQHHRGDPEGAWKAGYQGGRYHFGGGADRRCARSDRPDGGHQPGGREREPAGGAAEDRAVLRVCRCGGLCCHPFLPLDDRPGLRKEPAALSGAGLCAVFADGLLRRGVLRRRGHHRRFRGGIGGGVHAQGQVHRVQV